MKTSGIMEGFRSFAGPNRPRFALRPPSSGMVTGDPGSHRQDYLFGWHPLGRMSPFEELL